MGPFLILNLSSINHRCREASISFITPTCSGINHTTMAACPGAVHFKWLFLSRFCFQHDARLKWAATHWEGGRYFLLKDSVPLASAPVPPLLLHSPVPKWMSFRTPHPVPVQRAESVSIRKPHLQRMAPGIRQFVIF